MIDNVIALYEYRAEKNFNDAVITVHSGHASEGAKRSKQAREYKQIAEWLRELKQLKAEWTSCKDRLPDTDGQYLVTINMGMNDEVDSMMFISGCWMAFGNCKVIAWKPMPSAYRKEENDTKS